MLYDDGSRKHDIQEEIMRNSKIGCFTCDRAKMYPKIVKDLANALDKEIIRARTTFSPRLRIWSPSQRTTASRP